MVKVKVVGCKELSVLRNYKANGNDTENVIKKLNEGEVVEIDTSNVYWSWDDKPYYKIDLGYNNVGYVRTNALKVV